MREGLAHKAVAAARYPMPYHLFHQPCLAHPGPSFKCDDLAVTGQGLVGGLSQSRHLGITAHNSPAARQVAGDQTGLI